jgi:hypothetical protein
VLLHPSRSDEVLALEVVDQRMVGGEAGRRALERVTAELEALAEALSSRRAAPAGRVGVDGASDP